MSTSTDKKKKRKPTDPPKQKIGDTPVPPWEMPTPEEKAQVEPVRRALKAALGKVDSQEKADEVIEHIQTDEADQTVAEVEETPADAVTPAAAAQKVEDAARRAPEGQKTERVLETTARIASTGEKRQREAVAQAAQEVLNPEQQGAAPTVDNEQQREYLRKAVLKRLNPVDALDANLFLRVNHLPHTRLLNVLFYWITVMFNGGTTWYILVHLAGIFCSAKASFSWKPCSRGCCAFGSHNLAGGIPDQDILQTTMPVHHDHSGDRHRKKARYVDFSIRSLCFRFWRCMAAQSQVSGLERFHVSYCHAGRFFPHLPSQLTE